MTSEQLTKFFSDLATLIQQGDSKTGEAIDLIMWEIDTLLLAGDFDSVKQILDQATKETIPVVLHIGFLSITLVPCKKLGFCRVRYFNHVYNQVVRDYPEERLEPVLGGLVWYDSN